MGAWGPEPFENDSALDWASDLEGATLDTVRDALSEVLSAKGYIEVDEASAAVAAAELVAAALGQGGTTLPEDVAGWLQHEKAHVTTSDVTLALEALDRVLAGSELQQLWDEGGLDNPWRSRILELRRRLEQASSGA